MVAENVGNAVPLTCSWLAEEDTMLPAYVHTLSVMENPNAMEAAEHAMTTGMSCVTCEAAEGTPLSSTSGGVSAPFVHLVPSQCAVIALCIASNARLLEIHAGDGQAGDPPLLTCEAPTDAATGWRTHYLVNSADAPLESPLLPPSVSGYTIKFFARRPTAVLKIACFCLVCGPTAAHERDAGSGSAAALVSPRLTEDTDTSAQLQVPLEALAERLGRVESQMMVMMQLIMRRLDTLDERVSSLEGEHRHTVHS